MIRKYKNKLINIKPSRFNNFWYEIFINDKPFGQERSVESAIEIGESLIDDAINKLLDLDQTTVIDDVWEDYLDEDLEILNSLKLLSGLNTYEKILAMYEGYYIKDFLNKFN